MTHIFHTGLNKIRKKTIIIAQTLPYAFGRTITLSKLGDFMAKGEPRMRCQPSVTDWSIERFRAHAAGPRCITLIKCAGSC